MEASGGANVRDGAARITARLAVEAAQEAFPQWSATTPGERGALLQRASDLLMERQAAIATLVTEETSGTIGWGMFNVQLGAGMLAYYANHADVKAEEQDIHDEPSMPFGGVKHSGWGRFGGEAALEEFTELRWITIQDSPREYPI